MDRGHWRGHHRRREHGERHRKSHHHRCAVSDLGSSWERHRRRNLHDGHRRERRPLRAQPSLLDHAARHRRHGHSSPIDHGVRPRPWRSGGLADLCRRGHAGEPDLRDHGRTPRGNGERRSLPDGDRVLRCRSRRAHARQQRLGVDEVLRRQQHRRQQPEPAPLALVDDLLRHLGGADRQHHGSRQLRDLPDLRLSRNVADHADQRHRHTGRSADHNRPDDLQRQRDHHRRPLRAGGRDRDSQRSSLRALRSDRRRRRLGRLHRHQRGEPAHRAGRDRRLLDGDRDRRNHVQSRRQLRRWLFGDGADVLVHAARWRQLPDRRHPAPQLEGLAQQRLRRRLAAGDAVPDAARSLWPGQSRLRH